MVAKLLPAILHSFLRQLLQLCFRVWQMQAHHPSLAAGETHVFSAHTFRILQACQCPAPCAHAFRILQACQCFAPSEVPCQWQHILVMPDVKEKNK